LYENVVRKSGAIGYILDGDMIVLAKEMRPHRDAPKICFFGGMMEWDEKPHDAMARELLEETGMQGEFTLVWNVDFTVSESRLLEYIYRIQYATIVQEPSLEPGEKLELYRLPLMHL
jgi:8-oxo-dGTP pyrophosphatase MutT (NUDIX family)